MMKQGKKILCATVMLFMALSNCMKVAHAYTLSGMEDDIENPDWFDNQEGRAGDNTGTYKIDCSYPQINSDVIYFDQTHKSYQLVIRQYDKKKKIDRRNEDFQWEVSDERICTVDQNGLVKAGEMTGTTTVIVENKEDTLLVVVTNLTGKCEKWYEAMFTNNSVSGRYYSEENRDTLRSLGTAMSIVVDAYEKYGGGLHTNPEVRINTLRDAVNVILGSEYGIYTIFDLFLEKDREQKCAVAVDATRKDAAGYSPVVILLDGTIYELNAFGALQEIAPEEYGQWKKGYFYYNYMRRTISGEEEWKVKFSTEKEHDYENNRKYIENKLRGIKEDYE